MCARFIPENTSDSTSDSFATRFKKNSTSVPSDVPREPFVPLKLEGFTFF